MITEHRQGYIIEVKDTQTGDIQYVQRVKYYSDFEFHFVDSPLDAWIITNETYAQRIKNAVYKEYPKKDFGYTYRIRFIGIDYNYEII